METAAGLELGKDGRFRWGLSVGSLDMFAQGEWKRTGDFVILKADDADAELAKLLMLQRVSKVGEWLPRLPADHPLHLHPEGVAVRMLNLDDDGGAGSLYAFAADGKGEAVEWKDESLGEKDRWFIADVGPGESINVFHVMVAARLSRDIDIELKPGDVAEIAYSEAALQGEPKFLMLTLEIDKDGSLIPDAERFSDRPARYVRY